MALLIFKVSNVKLSYTKFSGTAPRISPYQLPSTFAQIAADTKLWSGEIRPFFQDIFVQTVPNDTQSVYKYRFADGSHVWLTWNIPVHIVKGPIFADANNRIIVSGLSGGLRITDATMLNSNSTTVDDTNSYTLAIPVATGIKMEVSGEAGSNKEARSYVISLVREWGDGKLDAGKTSEPAVGPNGSLTVDVTSGQTVTLSNITIPANVTSSAGVTKAYVYRSVVGSTGASTYAFVDEFPVTDDQTVYTYTDTKTTSALQESAISLEWDSPKDNLQGLISLNNGVLAAYSGTDVYFSYPYQPHAWPAEYRISVDYPIMGLGAFGNTVVVCTESVPVLVLVTDPASATVKPIQQNLPCTNAESIVNTSSGVIYSTQHGLVLINSTQPTIITDTYITKDEWEKWGAKSLRGTYYNDTYFGLFTEYPEVYGFMFDLTNADLGIVTINKMAQVIWSDVEDQDLYMVVPQMDGSMGLVVFDKRNEDFRSYRWKSKIDVSPQGIATLSAARVVADYNFAEIIGTYPYSYAYEDNSINGVDIHSLDINGPADMNFIYKTLIYRPSIHFKYYVDGIIKYDRFVYNNRPFRLPCGFRGDKFEIEVSGNFPIHYIDLATSIGELQ